MKIRVLFILLIFIARQVPLSACDLSCEHHHEDEARASVSKKLHSEKGTDSDTAKEVVDEEGFTVLIPDAADKSEKPEDTEAHNSHCHGKKGEKNSDSGRDCDCDHAAFSTDDMQVVAAINLNSSQSKTQSPDFLPVNAHEAQFLASYSGHTHIFRTVPPGGAGLRLHLFLGRLLI